MTQHIFVGEGEPNIVPQSLSAHYADTATGNQYVSVGTDSADDWRLSALAKGRTLVIGGGETLSVGQDVRVVRADISSGNSILTLTAAAVHGGVTFELFVTGSEQNPENRIVIRGPSAQDSIDYGAGAYNPGDYGINSSSAGDEVWLLPPTNRYPWMWLQISVVAGVVFVRQVDWPQLDE